MKKILIVVFGVFAVVGALYVGLMVFLSIGVIPTHSCRYYPVMAVDSTDGKFRAEQRQEICSKDNRVTTTVWLFEGGPDNLGGRHLNVFRALSTQAIPGKPGVYEPMRLQLAWLSNSELQISFPRGTEILHSDTNSNESRVTVRYQEIVAYGR